MAFQKISFRKGPISLEDEKLFHKRLIEYVKNENPTKKEICETFKDYENVMAVVEQQMNNGSIETFEKNGEVCYKTTEMQNKKVLSPSNKVMISV